MKRRIQLILHIAAVISSIIVVLTAMRELASTTGEFLVFLAATVLSFSVIAIYVLLGSRRVSHSRTFPFIYVSFPTNLDQERISEIKDVFNVFKAFPIVYSDSVVSPGDDYRKPVSELLKDDILQYYVIVCGGDLTPRQKFEVKLLRKTRTRITPIIDENGKIPQTISEFEPLSLDSFLSMYKASIPKTENRPRFTHIDLGEGMPHLYSSTINLDEKADGNQIRYHSYDPNAKARAALVVNAKMRSRSRARLKKSKKSKEEEVVPETLE